MTPPPLLPPTKENNDINVVINKRKNVISQIKSLVKSSLEFVGGFIVWICILAIFLLMFIVGAVLSIVVAALFAIVSFPIMVFYLLRRIVSLGIETIRNVLYKS
jgi:uncharacterized integral membrane protein